MFNFTLVSPESCGVSSGAICEFLSHGHNLGLHSFVMLRNGKCVSEAYFTPYAPHKRHMLFSLSKSFTSIACAFAVQDGILRYEDKVAQFFPDKLIPEEKKDLTIEHLLTMSVGTEEVDRFDGFDWIQDFLTILPAHTPGTHFRYDTSATFMVSAILTRLVNRSLECYLAEKLFAPLGIEEHHWEIAPDGTCKGGFGLNLRTRDIAKFGQFLLQKGMWEGKQLLAPTRIERATAKHIENGTPVEGQFCDWAKGYGYQFWRCEPDGVYRGDGAYGQFCIVMPKQDVVIAINSGTQDMQGILSAIWTTILPAISDTPALQENTDALHLLRKAETAAHIAFPEGQSFPQQQNGEYTLGGRHLLITVEDNTLFIEQLDGEKRRLLLRAGYRRWIDCGERSYAYAYQNGTLFLREVHDKTPFGHEHQFKIRENTLTENLSTFSGCVDPSFDLHVFRPGSKSILW